jgi:hypothetical protein
MNGPPADTEQFGGVFEHPGFFKARRMALRRFFSENRRTVRRIRLPLEKETVEKAPQLQIAYFQFAAWLNTTAASSVFISRTFPGQGYRLAIQEFRDDSQQHLLFRSQNILTNGRPGDIFLLSFVPNFRTTTRSLK